MGMAEEAPAPIKVPVWRTLTESFSLVFGRLGIFVRIGWLPYLIMLGLTISVFVQTLPVMTVVLQQTARHSPSNVTLPNIGWLPFLNGLAVSVQLICFIVFAVRWYQSVLNSDPYGWTWRQLWGGIWRFIVYLIIIYLFSFVCLAIGALSAWAVMTVVNGVPVSHSDAPNPVAIVPLVLVTFVVFAACVFRISLIFPAAAYGQPMSILQAWRCLRGNTWRLVGTIAILMLIILILEAGCFIFGGHLSALIFAPFFSSGAASTTIPPVVVGSLALLGLCALAAEFLVFAIFSSILSIFYREIALRAPR